LASFAVKIFNRKEREDGPQRTQKSLKSPSESGGASALPFDKKEPGILANGAGLRAA
jgi:hypothetical protein